MLLVPSEPPSFLTNESQLSSHFGKRMQSTATRQCDYKIHLFRLRFSVPRRLRRIHRNTQSSVQIVVVYFGCRQTHTRQQIVRFSQLTHCYCTASAPLDTHRRLVGVQLQDKPLWPKTYAYEKMITTTTLISTSCYALWSSQPLPTPLHKSGILQSAKF